MRTPFSCLIREIRCRSPVSWKQALGSGSAPVLPHSRSPHNTVIRGLVTAFSNSVGISSCCTAQFPATSLNILKSAHHHIPSGPAVNMALVDQVLHVMTPAEWGKPIDVDERWIAFVDDNVKASTCFLILFAPG